MIGNGLLIEHLAAISNWGHTIMGDLGRIGIIANPAAQSGEAAKAATRFYDALTRRLGCESCELSLTKHPGHAIDMAAQTGEHFDTLVVIGGDGIVHEAVNGLMQVPRDQRPQLAVVPVGSGNDYALTLGMPTDVKKALDCILACETKHFDIGRANDEYFAETMSFGIDAAIAIDTMERRKKTGKKGTRLYMEAGLDQILHHLTKYDYVAELDGVDGKDESVHLESSAYIFAIQIGPTYGGHFKVCPDADPSDGLFDICIAHPPLNPVSAAFVFMLAKSGKHTRFKNFGFYRARSLTLDFSEAPPCQADGEEVKGKKFDIECIHDGLTVITGNK